ncbi:MAG: glycosyltransferase family 39 protein [Acidobacteria bacterium]|nr:glycosyltransferase family 39 protein [Acidobacteriota bacterium]
MVTTVATLLVLFWLPGAVLFRLPIGDRDRRAGLDADERGFWAVVVSVAWTLGVTLALAAAGLYRFEALLFANLVTAGGLAAVARGRLRLGPSARRPTVQALVPVAIVVGGLWLYLPPSEIIVGGRDPGTYINEGIQVAQRGSLTVDDPVVATVPAESRDLFFPSHGNPNYYSLRFMGFFVMDPERGTVVGQFPHLYPASIAVAYGINGLSGARQASVAWTILGLLAVYYLTQRLAGRTAAAGVVLMLAVHVVVVWFARYPNAEVVMLALLFAALLAIARALVDGIRFFAPVAGLLVGLLLFLRYDVVLAVAGIFAALVVARVNRQRVGWGYAAVLVPLLGTAFVYLVLVMRPYAEYPLRFTREAGGALVAGAMLLAWLAAGWFGRHEAWRRGVVRLAPAGLVVLLVGLAIYAYFFREAVGRIALHDAMAFRTIAWYVTGWGLAAIVASAALVVPRLFWRDPAFFVVASTYCVFFFYKIRIVPEHFWMTRRFLPVVLPAMLLVLAAAVTWALGRDGAMAAFERLRGRPTVARRPRAQIAVSRAAALAVFVAIASVFWQASQPIAAHVEYAGLIPRIEQFSERFGSDDLVVVESRNSSDMHVVAVPLAYIYAKPVLVLASPRPDKRAFEQFLGWARDRYREVYFLGGGGTDLLSRRIAVVPVASERFQVPEYDAPVNAYPSGVRAKEFDFGLYRFVDPRDDPGWFVLDIGVDDDLHVVRFHAKERDGAGQAYRWTRDVSYVSVQHLTAESRMLTLWMVDGGRPPTAPPAEVEIALDERVLGRVVVDGTLRPYTFGIPADVAAAAAASDDPARLRISVPIWTPRAHLGTPDDRDLGVRLQRVEAR